VYADVLLTTEGRLLDGAVRMEGGGAALIMTPRTGPSLRAQADSILSLTLSRRTVKPVPGVRLTSGAFLPIESFHKLDGNVLRMSRPGGSTFDLPLSQLSLILFDPDDKLVLPPGSSPGVLLRSGDFFEGEMTLLSEHTLVISSTLFGERRFRLDRDVLAVRLRSAVKPQGKWIIRLTDGTIARSSSLSIDGGQLKFDDPAAGPLTATLDQLVELRRGDNPFVPISPADTAPPTEFPLTLRGPAAPWGASGKPIAQQAGTVRDLDLADGAKALLLRAGVPAALVPSQSVRVVVLVDGKQIYRSPPLTSVDDAVIVSIPLTGKKALTLRVEGQPPAMAVWSDLALLK
jgi:hypothetical protein